MSGPVSFMIPSDRLTNNCVTHFPSYTIAVWGLRTYAVFRRSKIILVIFGSLELVVIGLSAVRMIPISTYGLGRFNITSHSHQLHVQYVSCTTSIVGKEPLVPPGSLTCLLLADHAIPLLRWIEVPDTYPVLLDRC